MLSRARLAVLLSSVVLAASLVPVAPAIADETPTPDPTPTVEVVTPDPEPTPTETPTTPPAAPTTPTVPAKPPVSDPPATSGAALPSDQGTVTIVHTTTPFLAVTNGWPDDTSFAFQWYRGASATTATTAIAGATLPTYTPTNSDANQFLRVRVIGTNPDAFSPAATRYSVATNYKLVVTEQGSGNPSGASVQGFPALVGNSVHLEWNELAQFSSAGIPAGGAPVLTNYQWLRNGVAIAGATGANYTLTSVDLGKNISALFTATAPGATPTRFTSFATLVQPLAFGSPNLTISGPTALKLTANLTYTDPRPDLPGLKVTYQWYRYGTSTTAISGATGASYTMTSADANVGLGVKVTLSKPGYTAVPPLEYSDNYTWHTSGKVAIVPLDQVKIGGTLTVSKPGYTVGYTGFSPDPSTISFTYQWLRDGVAISAATGGTGATYQPTTSDLNKALSVRVTASYGGYLPLTLTSAATPKIGGFNTFTDNGSPIVLSGTGIPGTLSVGATGVTDVAGESIAYQWLRDGNVAIAGATHSTYTMTPADYGHDVGVRLTFTAPGYTTYVKTEGGGNHDLWSYDLPGIGSTATAPYRVGDTLGLVMPDYRTPDDNIVTPTATFQWLRNGVAIAGATSGSYRLQPADLGTRISIRVNAGFDGLNSMITTSSQTAPVVVGQLIVNPATPVVTNDDGLLTATLPPGTVVTLDTTLSYQWYRQTGTAAPVAITGFTHQTYLLVAADLDKKISVKVTVSKANVIPTSVPLTSTGVDYTIKPGAIPAVVNGPNKVGTDLYAIDGTYVNAAGTTVPTTLSLQWYRNGVAITGAISNVYTLTAADLGKNITARFTERASGYVSRTIVVTPSSGAVTGLGILTDIGEPYTPVFGLGTQPGQLTVVSDGHFDQSGLTVAVQWKRNGVAVKGATGGTFTLASTDANSLISYSITFSKPGYASTTRTAVAHRFGIVIDSAVAGNLVPIYAPGQDKGRVGGSLEVRYDLGNWKWEYAETGTQVLPTLSYQWYRNGVAIAGATASIYHPIALDYLKTLTVRVYAKGPGMVPASVLSGQSLPIDLGVNTNDGSATVSINRTTSILTASLASLSPATPAPVLSYQWLRSGNPIPGATSSTYKLSPLDFDRSISVQIKVVRDKFTVGDDSYFVTSSGLSYSATQNGVLSLTSSPVFGIPVTVPLPDYRDGSGNVPSTTPTYTFTWFRLSQPSLFGTVAIIPGENKQTYTPTTLDVGKWLAVTVTPHYPGYLTIGSNSPISGQVALNSFTWSGMTPTVTASSASPPVLTGHVMTGLSVAPTSYSYHWARQNTDGTGYEQIPGATGATLTPSLADRYEAFRIEVTAHRAGYHDLTMISAWVSYSTSFSLTSTGSGSTTGTTRGVLASAVSPSTGMTFKYQWLREGIAITGATTSSYTFTASDVGKTVSVQVLGYAPGRTPTSLTLSIATGTAAVMSHVGSAVPVMSFANASTLQLKVTYNGSGQFSPAATSYTYQWARISGGSPVSIPGATSSTYTLTQADYGYSTFVIVTAHRAGYTSFPVSSTIVNYNLGMVPPTISPSGTQSTDTVLTAHAGALAPAVTGATYTYRWYRENVVTHVFTLVKTTTTSATASTYTLTPADVAGNISVRIHVTKAGYLSKTEVQGPSVAAVTGVIVGPTSVGVGYNPSTHVLSANVSGFTTTGVKITYQWLRNGAPVSGATAATYTPSAAMRSGVWQVNLTYSKAGYTTKYDSTPTYTIP